ncbi:MAG: hypothetical protein JWP97_5373 [Labilithrix sp.]|nr:hypothetical protein [Labilithrix sp.]
MRRLAPKRLQRCRVRGLLSRRTTNPEEREKYARSATAASVGPLVKARAFYAAVDTLEGPPVDGAVVLHFPPSRTPARLPDPLYEKAQEHRLTGAEYRVFVVDVVRG